MLFTLTGTTVSGPVSVAGAYGEVEISAGKVTGPVSLVGNGAGVRVDAATMNGPVTLIGNTGSQPVVVAGNTIAGPLSCALNDPAPINESRTNSVRGPATGQCARL
ncbi:hypothetical protein B0E53_02542 [Micromonospora sp. MH33]|uniref:hypothetical protein n=1 Tax=Micromonospora sp. MH33 TaxID=1945509 RepID=UPI000D14A6D3|nr:hypothetical protein [Micromonospora sp. MH33]PSK65485.1 hypothetical protein B0E53_02542 [Micromonospora sp. MH33]